MFTNSTIYNLVLFSSARVLSEAKIVVVGDQRRKEGTKLGGGSSRAVSARPLHVCFQNRVPVSQGEVFPSALVRNSKSSSCIIRFIHRSRYTLKS